jgi:hypothetical protein
LKIQATDIQTGDRIVAYCNNKMQICTVKHIVDSKLTNISLSVSISNTRNSSHVIRFRRDALVELNAKARSQDRAEFCAVPEPVEL